MDWAAKTASRAERGRGVCAVISLYAASHAAHRGRAAVLLRLPQPPELAGISARDPVTQGDGALPCRDGAQPRRERLVVEIPLWE